MEGDLERVSRGKVPLRGWNYALAHSLDIFLCLLAWNKLILYTFHAQFTGAKTGVVVPGVWIAMDELLAIEETRLAVIATPNTSHYSLARQCFLQDATWSLTSLL